MSAIELALISFNFLAIIFEIIGYTFDNYFKLVYILEPKIVRIITTNKV